MKAIYKLNDTLRYSTQINNRNVVAAICAQEFDEILKYTSSYADQKFIENLIQLCLRDIHSNVPMKLFQLEDLLFNYEEHHRKRIEPIIIIDGNGGGNNTGNNNGDNPSIDLSNYYTRRETDVLLSKKQDELIAGDNVEIENDVISVDLSGIEGGGSSIDVYNEYGDSTTGAISQDFFTEEVQANTEGVRAVTENVQVIAEEVKSVNEGVKNIEEGMKTQSDDIAALEAAVFPFKINYLRGGGTYEKGSVQSVTLTWEYDRDIDSQYINNIGISSELRTKTYTNVTKDTTYTLSATSGSQTISSSVSAKFSLKKYWGVSSKTSLSNNEILALNSGWAQRTMGSTTFDCTGGKYPYYILPTSMISGIEFWINGLQNTDWVTEQISLTNASGYTESYTVFRLNTIQTGVLKIEVK